jgi:glycosyltransferase involved in cell wall biosynthesis
VVAGGGAVVADRLHRVDVVAPHQDPLVTVVIPTFNRAALLGETLDRLAGEQTAAGFAWDVLVVDNNSTDDTARSVRERQPQFPVPLHYRFEGRQGRSHAPNAGIGATTSPVLAFVDDDVVVGDGWLDAATAPLLAAGGCDYTGGPVKPIWEAPRPRWLAADKSDIWGTIAILDYGADPFVFEERRRVPLGANMAVRRSLIDRIGGFSPRLGRSGSRALLGQEVPEFLSRARAAGARGAYVPAMVVHHHVPARRLTKSYFRRWWYGKGLSRAELERLQPITELGVDLSTTRHIAGVPAFMLRTAFDNAVQWLGATLRFDAEAQFRNEMMLCFFAGYVVARQREGRALRPAVVS